MSALEMILLGLVSLVLLGAIMPALLSVSGNLIGVLAGHPVELMLAGLLPFVLIIAVILNVLRPQEEMAY